MREERHCRKNAKTKKQAYNFCCPSNQICAQLFRGTLMGRKDDLKAPDSSHYFKTSLKILKRLLQDYLKTKLRHVKEYFMYINTALPCLQYLDILKTQFLSNFIDFL